MVCTLKWTIIVQKAISIIRIVHWSYVPILGLFVFFYYFSFSYSLSAFHSFFSYVLSLGCNSVVVCPLKCCGLLDQSLLVNPLSYFLFQPVYHPLCGMVHIKDIFLLIEWKEGSVLFNDLFTVI